MAKNTDDKPEWVERLMPGVWKKLSTLWVGEVVITPEAAAELLEKHNGKNRPITLSRVEKIKRALRDKLWMLTGETLIFDTDGNGLSQQHRNTACKETGIPYETLAVYGVSPAVYKVIDSGTPKNVGQRIAMEGEKNYALLAATASMLISFLNTGKFHRSLDKTKDYQEVRDFIDKYPSVRETVNSMKSNRKGNKLTILGGPSLACSLMWTMGKSSLEANRFAQMLIESVTQKMTPPEWPNINVLTNRLDLSRTRDLATFNQRAALSIKAFNSRMSGKVDASKFLWTESDEFPRIWGWKYDDAGKPVPPPPEWIDYTNDD